MTAREVQREKYLAAIEEYYAPPPPGTKECDAYHCAWELYPGNKVWRSPQGEVYCCVVCGMVDEWDMDELEEVMLL